MTTMSKHLFLSIALTGLLAACGGSPKSGLKKGTDEVPPPPDVTAGGGGEGKDGKTPTFTKDARKDYEAAAAYFAENEKNGWNGSACKGSADKFASVAGEHKIVEAQYMVGRSYHACNMLEDAESAYQAALKMNKNHAPSISNLGELYWQAGKKDGAKDYWETAVKADPKIIAARANLAMLMIEDLRTIKGDEQWKKTEKAARDHLSSVLAVDNDHLKAYVLYGLLYMEGRQKNKNRLDLAKLLLDEAKKRKEDYAPLQHAYGLYYLYKNNLTEALASFEKAVQLDPDFAEAHINVGLIKLGYRKYEDAKTHFDTTLKLTGRKSYDALIGLGVAMRGLGDLEKAKAAYDEAIKLDDKRGEAYFDLGVLHQDFIALKQPDLKDTVKVYKQAKEYFQSFLKKSGIKENDKEEAEANIKVIDKNVKQTEEFMKNQPPPDPTPAPAEGGGGKK